MDSNDDVVTHAMDTAPRDVERASMGEVLDDSATRDIQDVRAGASVRRAYTARTNTLLTQASSDGDDRIQSMCVWRTCRMLPLKPVRVELQARRDLIKMCAGRAPASAMIDAFSTPSTSVHFEIMLDVRIRDAGDPFKCACPSLIAREMLERVAAQPQFGAIPAETMSRALVIDQTNTTDDVLDDSEAHAFKQAFYTKSAVVVPYTSRVLENQRIVILARLATPTAFDDGNSGGDDGSIRFVCLVLSGDAMPPAKTLMRHRTQWPRSLVMNHSSRMQCEPKTKMTYVHRWGVFSKERCEHLTRSWSKKRCLILSECVAELSRTYDVDYRGTSQIGQMDLRRAESS